MEILDGAERHFSAETFNDLILLGPEFGCISLTTSLALQRDVPWREENGHDLLQELDRSLRGTTIEAEFQSIRDAFPTVQRRISVIEEKSDEKLKQFCRN
jgi:hypothetical protein